MFSLVRYGPFWPCSLRGRSHAPVLDIPPRNFLEDRPDLDPRVGECRREIPDPRCATSITGSCAESLPDLGDDEDEPGGTEHAVWPVHSVRELQPRPYRDPCVHTLSATDRAKRWTANFTQGTSTTLVADDDGMIVGFVSFGPSRDDDAPAHIAELYSIYLLPARWRAGVGTLLHDAALQQLAGQFDAATLWVLRGNDRAMSFYQRHEWAPDGQAKAELRPGGMRLDEVRLRRRVGARSVR
jgi:GNAT superfamily N-acetyltransferase